eukprot:878662-Alexandrium_andersonii.AAC.1
MKPCGGCRAGRLGGRSPPPPMKPWTYRPDSAPSGASRKGDKFKSQQAVSLHPATPAAAGGHRHC